jgi:DNA-directed RNA polymerase subunit M
MRLVLNQKTTKRNFLFCPKCDYKKTLDKEALTPLNIVNPSSQEQIAIIGEEEAKIDTMPKLKIECPKCSHHEAYWWMVQTRGADESPTQFFRCTKCSYTWREMA